MSTGGPTDKDKKAGGVFRRPSLNVPGVFSGKPTAKPLSKDEIEAKRLAALEAKADAAAKQHAAQSSKMEAALKVQQEKAAAALKAQQAKATAAEEEKAMLAQKKAELEAKKAVDDAQLFVDLVAKKKLDAETGIRDAEAAIKAMKATLEKIPGEHDAAMAKLESARAKQQEIIAKRTGAVAATPTTTHAFEHVKATHEQHVSAAKGPTLPARPEQAIEIDWGGGATNNGTLFTQKGQQKLVLDGEDRADAYDVLSVKGNQITLNTADGATVYNFKALAKRSSLKMGRGHDDDGVL